VLLLGPMPTPAVAMLTKSMRADLGVMISASHNLFEDNGIKLFGPQGFKLSDDVERQIEQLLDESLDRRLAQSASLGRARRIDGVHDRYIEFAKRTLPRDLSLDGLRVVIDCANGAAYKVVPEALWELGADVVPIGVAAVAAAVLEPDPAGRAGDEIGVRRREDEVERVALVVRTAVDSSQESSLDQPNSVLFVRAQDAAQRADPFAVATYSVR
jgi:hypothetical protein